MYTRFWAVHTPCRPSSPGRGWGSQGQRKIFLLLSDPSSTRTHTQSSDPSLVHPTSLKNLLGTQGLRRRVLHPSGPSPPHRPGSSRGHRPKGRWTGRYPVRLCCRKDHDRKLREVGKRGRDPPSPRTRGLQTHGGGVRTDIPVEERGRASGGCLLSPRGVPPNTDGPRWNQDGTRKWRVSLKTHCETITSVFWNIFRNDFIYSVRNDKGSVTKHTDDRPKHEKFSVK